MGYSLVQLMVLFVVHGSAFHVYRKNEVGLSTLLSGSELSAAGSAPGSHPSPLFCFLCQNVIGTDPGCLQVCPPPRHQSPHSEDSEDVVQLHVSEESNSLEPRQVDPLQSCIEARCSRLPSRSLTYTSCIYKRCIISLRLGKQQLLQHKRAMMLNPSSDDIQANTEDQDDDAASDENGDSKGSMDHHVYTMRLEGISRRSQPIKRSWNDLAGTCVEFHCPGKTPGSLEYSICAQRRCANFLRR